MTMIGTVADNDGGAGTVYIRYRKAETSFSVQERRPEVGELVFNKPSQSVLHFKE